LSIVVKRLSPILADKEDGQNQCRENDEDVRASEESHVAA